MFKRQFNLFVLLFAFAFAQIGMVMHEISHYADAKTSHRYIEQTQAFQLGATQNNDQDSLNKPCTTCLAYSAIGHGHLVNNFVFNVAVFEQHYFLANENVHFTRHVSYYPARAPPSLV